MTQKVNAVVNFDHKLIFVLQGKKLPTQWLVSYDSITINYSLLFIVKRYGPQKIIVTSVTHRLLT